MLGGTAEGGRRYVSRGWADEGVRPYVDSGWAAAILPVLPCR